MHSHIFQQIQAKFGMWPPQMVTRGFLHGDYATPPTMVVSQYVMADGILCWLLL